MTEPASPPHGPADATVPPSRRAAREAAAQAATGPAAIGSPDAAHPAATPVSTSSASTPQAPPAPARHDDHADALGDLFAASSTAHQPRRKRHVGRWIALTISLLLVGGLVTGGVYVWNTYGTQIREALGWGEPKDYQAGQAQGEALVTIASGDIPSTISGALYDAGVTKTRSVFYDMLIATKQNPMFYPGVYRLQKQMTAAAALEALQDPANKLENSALLREGLTVAQILPILADSLKIPLADFEAAVKDPAAYGVAAKSLEGWLFPAMYTFDPGITAPQVIQSMVDRTRTALDEAGVPEADRQRILIVASIIQREARFEADFFKVSRVIENRLDPDNGETFGLLQMDSTAQYGFGEMHDGTVSSSAEALADDNPWNTYIHPGLPIGPISNPGATAIDAAMHPADGPWLYFVTVNLNTGETVFSKTLAEHERAVTQWQQWCRDNPNAGC